MEKVIKDMATKFKALATLTNVDTSGFEKNQLLYMSQSRGGEFIGGKILTDKEVEDWLHMGWIDSGAAGLIDGSNKTTIHLATQNISNEHEDSRQYIAGIDPYKDSKISKGGIYIPNGYKRKGETDEDIQKLINAGKLDIRLKSEGNEQGR